MRKPVIPRLEPEAARNRHGCDDEVPTTSMRDFVFEGVKIRSRYRKAHEYELVVEMIAALPAELRDFVQSIFCDSKATFVFSVTLRSWAKARAQEIGQRLAEVALARNGGHNGIDVTAARGPDDIFGDDDRRIDLDPDWDD